MLSPELLSLIVWIPFLFLAVVFGTVFCILGFRRGSIKAAISIGVTILSTLLSVLLARLLAGAVASASTPLISDIIGNDELLSMEHFSALVTGCATAVSALILFIPCFMILLLIFKNLTSLLFTARIPKAKNVGNKLGGLALGLVDALLVSFLILLPVYGTLHMGGNLFAAVTALSAEEDTNNETISIPVMTVGTNGSPLSTGGGYDNGSDAPSYEELVDALCNTPLSDIAGLPIFTTVYDSMASFTHDGETVSVSKTVNTVSQVVTAVVSYKNGEEDSGAKMIDALDHLEKVMTESSFFAGLACDVVGNSLDENELVGSYQGFTDKTVLQEDMSALFTVARSAVENNILPVFFEEEPDLSEIELGTFPYDIAEALNSTESLASLKAELVNTVIDEALKSVAGDDEAKLAELRATVGTVDATPLTGDDVKAEGDSLYLLLSSATKATSTENTADAGALAGNLIEGLARHPSFGVDKVVDIADSLLGLSGEGGEAGSAVKDTLKDALNASVSKPVEDATFGQFVGTTVNAADVLSKIKNGETDPEAMEALLSANPEVLEQLEDTLNEELLTALGLEGEQSAMLTSLVNTLFTTLRETELTEAERKAESVVLSDALAQIFALPGTEDLDAAANNLISCYLDSKILCASAEALTSMGNDPFGLNLSASDKAEIRTILNEKIAEFAAEEGAEEKLGYLASLIGVELN